MWVWESLGTHRLKIFQSSSKNCQAVISLPSGYFRQPIKSRDEEFDLQKGNVDYWGSQDGNLE